MSVPKFLPGVTCLSALALAQAALTILPCVSVSLDVLGVEGDEGDANVVCECQALVSGNAADLLEDEGVWAADGSQGDDDDLGCGDGA